MRSGSEINRWSSRATVDLASNSALNPKFGGSILFIDKSVDASALNRAGPSQYLSLTNFQIDRPAHAASQSDVRYEFMVYRRILYEISSETTIRV